MGVFEECLRPEIDLNINNAASHLGEQNTLTQVFTLPRLCPCKPTGLSVWFALRISLSARSHSRADVISNISTLYVPSYQQQQKQGLLSLAILLRGFYVNKIIRLWHSTLEQRCSVLATLSSSPHLPHLCSTHLFFFTFLTQTEH